ncbi:hypothetical protein AC578_5865 [Pseudocercospora eumusae]|uniref:Uncharacterized protein n=1 Tax=Pseudocercospora eumusae TaxID=321146 RepID=A0A139HD24_9PEZI|nr:hypothetical protein AC578_5865 [Pseudocercospora eumusae]
MALMAPALTFLAAPMFPAISIKVLVCLGAVGLQKPILAFKDTSGPHNTCLSETDTHECIVNSKSWVQTLVPASVLEILH